MNKCILDIIKHWGLFLLLFFQPKLPCAAENYQIGARALALSSASVSFSDCWAGFHNQAGLAGVVNPMVGFFFESRFGVDELSLMAGTVTVPAYQGTFAISLYQFGKGAFRENKYGLAYARHLSHKLSAGLQLDYFTQLFPENVNVQGFATFEGGIIFRPTGKLHLGIHLFNPLREGFETMFGKQEMPLIFRAGGHYIFDKIVLIAFETEKDNKNPLVVKSGIEFFPVENLAFRLGVSGKPFKYAAGLGYNIGRLSADISFSYHGNLGFTPLLSVQLNL